MAGHLASTEGGWDGVEGERKEEEREMTCSQFHKGPCLRVLLL